MEKDLHSGNMQWVEIQEGLDIGYSKHFKVSFINMFENLMENMPATNEQQEPSKTEAYISIVNLGQEFNILANEIHLAN